MSHATDFFRAFSEAAGAVLNKDYYDLRQELLDLRGRGGRLFVLGVGGGAANAAHAVNDFRKLCDIEAYAPTDSVAELTARTNDDGWESVFWDWLRISNLRDGDAVLVLSVGGGQPAVSGCISMAVRYAKEARARVLGVVGLAGGVTVELGDAVVVCGAGIDDRKWLTPVTETMQIAVLHALVSDPVLRVHATKW